MVFVVEIEVDEEVLFVQYDGGVVDSAGCICPRDVFEGTGNDMSWYELYRVAVLEDLSSIQSVKANNGDDKVYNLQGVQLNSPQRGINIVNGKKMVVK